MFRKTLGKKFVTEDNEVVDDNEHNDNADEDKKDTCERNEISDADVIEDDCAGDDVEHEETNKVEAGISSVLCLLPASCHSCILEYKTEAGQWATKKKGCFCSNV